MRATGYNRSTSMLGPADAQPNSRMSRKAEALDEGIERRRQTRTPELDAPHAVDVAHLIRDAMLAAQNEPPPDRNPLLRYRTRNNLDSPHGVGADGLHLFTGHGAVIGWIAGAGKPNRNR